MRTPIMVRFPQAMIDELDKISAERLDGPDRSSIIREFIAEAIEARRKRTN